LGFVQTLVLRTVGLNMEIIPIEPDCRQGNFKCSLGATGCTSPQISGQPASHVAESQESERKCLRPVPPLGPDQYDLVVIGEIPAISDDKLDMVWVDNSGGEIIEYLRKAGHDLNRVWMTKIAKCRPQVKGRKAAVSELHTCRDIYLRQEIELIQPKVVIAVGAPGLRAFNLLGNGSINSIHGKVFGSRFARQSEMKDPDFEAQPVYKVIPTINPAVFFYNPNKKLQARIGHDYLVAKDLLDGKEASDHFISNYTLVDTPEKLEWLKEKLLNTNLFGWDTESTGLGFRKSPVISYQFAWGWEPDQCAVLPITQHDPDAPEDQEFHLKPGFGAKNEELVTEFMRDVFLTPHIAKAAHNHKYDINVLRWGYGINIQGFLYDTWTMKHLQNELPPADLAFLCDLEFGWGDYESSRRAITGSGKKLKKGFDKVPDKILWQYGATDALGTYRLACLYAQSLQTKKNLWDFHTVESEPLQRSLARAEYKGALIQQEAMDLLSERFEREQKELLTRMRGTLSKPDFNPSSSPQVLDAFLVMGVAHIELEDETNASGMSADKKKLIDIVEEGKQPQARFAADVISYRNRTKMISTYLDNCRKDMDSDGRVRYSWVIAGPVTGRLSCRFFHQIPKIDESIVCYGPDGAYVPFEQRLKDKKIVMRDMFTVPEGYTYVCGDFSQVELRILAIESQDQEMLAIMNDPDGDLHMATALEFLSPVWVGMRESDVSKFNRTEVGKRINFGLAYGSEGFALVKAGKWQDMHGVEHAFTWDMLNKGMARWKARFKGVGAFIDNTPNEARAFGGTCTHAFGRERHFGPRLNMTNDYERGAAEREAVNFKIQGPASSITNRTIIGVDDVLAQHNVGDHLVCLINTVHDSVGYEVRDSHVEWFIDALRTISGQPFKELGGASFRMDIGRGQVWSDAEMTA